MLLKYPTTTAFALIALALGIGANTAIFSVVNAVLLRPLPYPHSEQLLRVSLEDKRQGPEGGPLSVADFLDWRAHNQKLEVAAYGTNLFSCTSGDTPEQIRGAVATSAFFSTLGVNAAVGRTFLPNEETLGAPPVVVLSHNLWKQRFNADPNVIGDTLVLDEKNYTIIGVMPTAFRFPDQGVQLWTAFQPKPPTRRGPYFLDCIARFKSGTIDQARVELAATAQRIRAAVPELNPEYGFVGLPLNEVILGNVRPALFVLLGAVALVLLIACVNVANLLLARAAARTKEITVRRALGASRSRIARQFLTESFLLACAGGAMGLLFAWWSLDVLLALIPQSIPRLQDVAINRAVFAWTAFISIATGLGAGIAPALQGSRLNLSDSLKEDGRGASESRGRKRLRGALVASEIALALMLLISAGLLIKSFLRLQNVDPGFKADRVLTVQVPLTSSKYDEHPQIVAFYERLLERVRALPAVNSAAVCSGLPPDQLSMTDNYSTEAQRNLDDDHLPIGSLLLVSPDYFKTLGIPLKRGRVFNEHDSTNAPRVVVINETLARRTFPNQNPIGQRLKQGGTNRPTNEWMEIVGVVGDVKYEGLQVATTPAFYQSLAQNSFGEMSLVINASGDPRVLVGDVRNLVRAIDPAVPLARIKTMDQLLGESVAQPRFRTLLLGIFSAVALLLSAVGIYGVMAYSVTERTREIGIRMALGAQALDVLKLVVRQGLFYTLVGVVFGVAGAFALTRVISNLLFGVGATDPATFIGVSAFLVLVSLAACYLPARRASKVNPVKALAHS